MLHSVVCLALRTLMSTLDGFVGSKWYLGQDQTCKGVCVHSLGSGWHFAWLVFPMKKSCFPTSKHNGQRCCGLLWYMWQTLRVCVILSFCPAVPAACVGVDMHACENYELYGVGFYVRRCTGQQRLKKDGFWQLIPCVRSLFVNLLVLHGCVCWPAPLCPLLLQFLLLPQ